MLLAFTYKDSMKFRVLETTHETLYSTYFSVSAATVVVLTYLPIKMPSPGASKNRTRDPKKIDEVDSESSM